MKLGIDFGTTRIVVASADRGNYPLVHFECPDHQTRDWFPPLVALGPGEIRYGFDTWPVSGRPDWTVIRSLKRLLKGSGPRTLIETESATAELPALLVGLLDALNRQLRTSSTLRLQPSERFEVMIGVPANANSNQRFLTAEAFRAAGFQVLGMLNEPSAASIEYGHCDQAARKAQNSSTLLVYDLGGGTFDASLVDVSNAAHEVVASTGIQDLGGDDFDEILAALALEASGMETAERDSLTSAELFRLLDECRERKEALNPNTRKLVIDLERVREGWEAVSVATSDFYDRCRPLIGQTESMVTDLLAAHPDHPLDTLYITGGGSELPAVSRILKETFGRRVRRSAYMRSATAIGLAIAADRASAYRVRDRFAENFGVWRESDHGQNVEFDVLFKAGLQLPPSGGDPVRVTRGYHPAHNLGHFRYVECSAIDPSGQPTGDVTLWDSVLFAFDPSLRTSGDLADIPVVRSGGAMHNWVQEEYSCDESGRVKVTISDLTSGYRRDFALGRWSADVQQVRPVRNPAHRRRASATS